MPISCRAACLPFVAALCAAVPLLGQSSMQPTPKPAITAEHKAWFTSGEPIAFGGHVYYPSGPITHFLRNEMVPAGTFDDVPIYVRTTQEPGSLVYVPLPGGLVRPYERRRTGELAGTVGSTAPAFPVVLPTDQAKLESAPAQAPPDIAVGTAGPAPARSLAPPAGPAPVGTVGRSVAALARMPPQRTRIQTAERPAGLNEIFVQFENRRWLAAGPPVEYAPGRFAAAGEHRGFLVYKDPDRPDVIYVPVVPGAPGLLTPYRAR